MRVEGRVRFDGVPPERVFDLLLDREVLRRCTPGCKSLDEEAPGRFHAELEVGVAAVKGRYAGTLATEDLRPPEHFRLVVDVAGASGFVQADVALDLAPEEHGTALTYGGEAQVGGPVAGVGQRVLGGVSKLIIGQFFAALGREVRQAAVAAEEGPGS